MVKERIDRGGMREQENIDDHIILKWERKKSKKKKNFLLFAGSGGYLDDVSVVFQ